MSECKRGGLGAERQDVLKVFGLGSQPLSARAELRVIRPTAPMHLVMDRDRFPPVTQP